MNDNFKISVVMAVYKNDNHLFFKQAVNSLLNQTYMPSEIIIVVDGTVNKKINNVINQLSLNNLIKIIKLPINKGLANALNIGISSSKYDLIARMDADDICFVDRFEKQVKFLTNENLDLVGGQIIEFGNNFNDIISERKVPITHQEIIRFMKFRSPFNHPTILFKKKVFDSINGYDVKIFPEDYDFFVRVYLSGHKMGNLIDNVLWFRLGKNFSESLRRRWGLLYAKNEYLLYKKCLKLGFLNKFDFIKLIIFKISLRFLPFSIFKFIYFKISR